MSEMGPRLSSGRVPRLFVDTALEAGASVELKPEAAHYLMHVLRLPDGAEVLAFDNRTGEWRTRLSPAKKRAALVVETPTRPRETVPDLWLCAAPLKKGRIDWVAEKACELGVARLVPTLTQHSVVEKLNTGRLRAHMIEAAEQCGRTALPEIVDPVRLEALLGGWPAERALIFCDENGGGEALAAMASAPAPAAILIGPEGGFSDSERRAIRALPQTVPVSLGPRVLRADTAAAAAVALWMAASGDWRGFDGGHMPRRSPGVPPGL